MPMQKKIKRRDEVSVFSNEDHLHPLLKKIYAARGVKSLHELEKGLARLLPYQSLLGIEQAVVLLVEALSQQQKILIVGDFDADGATSTAVAIRALKSFGAKNIDYLVPNRFSYGYGLTPELVEVAKTLKPNLIVTVDNGIANHAGVLAAKNAGMRVIITDHHLPSETLPAADAIVNPNQLHDLFPSKHIAGVGVIFYVMLALRRYLIDQKWFSEKNIKEPNMSRLLDIVALGTVADVVSLDHNNRILVHQGLLRIRSGQCIPGILALLEVGSRNYKNLIAADLGFAIAPRLNAAGRLEDMSLGIECLLTDDMNVAREIAVRLNQLNEERRVIEQEMQEQAFKILSDLKSLKTETLPRGIALFDESWHQGVIGIVASRIKDKFHRPVIAFALSNDNELKGSGRSIVGFHLRDALAQIATQYPDLIIKFGGHAMASGLTIARESFLTFSKAFDEIVSKHLNEEDLNQALWSDGELAAHECSLETAEILREGGPWGQSFPEPLFEGLFQLVDQRIVGGKHLKMVLKKENQIFDAIAFNVDLNQWPNHRLEQVNTVFKLDINEFRGKRGVQLIIEHVEIA